MAQKNGAASAAKLIRKTVSHRKVEFHNAPAAPTLEQLLLTAKNALPTVHERREAIDAAGTELRFISDWGVQKGGGVFGRLSTVQKGKFPVALRDDASAKTIPLTAFKPPAGQDYCPGVCHFLVVENHVVMSQSLLLRTAALEAHLAWLFRNPTKLLQADQGIALSDEPQKATKERIRRSHVKSVMLGRPILEATSVVGKGQNQRTTFKADVKGPVFQMLKDFLESKDLEKLNLADGVFDSNLEVWIEIRYPKHSRAQSGGAVKLLDELSLALRDVDSNDIKLSLLDGSVVTGKELKVSTVVEVELMGSGGQISESDLYVQMKEALRMWIKNGIISPN
ncbi:MAG: hypothetical protein ACO1PN_15890 [Betaproteobacteria bacterium]